MERATGCSCRPSAPPVDRVARAPGCRDEPGPPLLGTVGQCNRSPRAPIGWWRELIGLSLPLRRAALPGVRQPAHPGGGGGAASLLAGVALATPTAGSAGHRLRHLQRVVNNSRFLVLLAGAPAAGGWPSGWLPIGTRASPEPLLRDAGGSPPLCRHLLPGCQLDRTGTPAVAGAWIAPMPAMARHRSLVYPLVANAQRRLVEAVGAAACATDR